MKKKKEQNPFAFWPWEQGEKPYFVGAEGWEWYVDKSLTEYATSKNKPIGKPLNAVCFIVAKDGKPNTRVLVGPNQEVLYEHTCLENMAVRIDMLRIAKAMEEIE